MSDKDFQGQGASLRWTAWIDKPIWLKMGEVANEGIWCFDRNGKTLYANPKMAELMECTIEDIDGCSIFDYVDSPQKENLYSYIENHKQGERGKIPITLHSPKGSDIKTILDLVPILDKQGAYQGMISLISEIISDEYLPIDTPRIAHQWQGFFKSTIDGCIIYTLDGRLLDANAVYCHMTGYSHDRLLSMTFFDLEPSNLIEQAREHQYNALTKGFDRFETRHLSSEKSLIDVEISTTYDENGKLFISFIRDISERKHRERQLQINESHLQHTQEMAQVGSYFWDIRQNQFWWSDELFRILGCPKQEPSLELILSQLHPDDRDAVIESGTRAQKLAIPFKMDYRILRPDGEVRWVHDRAEVICDENGQSHYMAGALQDVTDRKMTENALLESELLYKSLVESAPDGVFLIQKGRCAYINPAGCQLLNKDTNTLFGTPFIDNIHPKNRNQIESLLKNPQPCEFNELLFRREDQTALVCESTFIPVYLKGNPAILLICRDITERKHAESQIRFQAMVLDQIEDRVTATDLEGQLTYANEAEARFFGIPREKFIGENVSIYAEDPSRGASQREIINHTLLKGEWRGEVVNYSPSGTESIIDYRTRLIRDDSGKPIAVCGIATDITERKYAEKALRDSEDKYRRLIEAANEGVWMMDDSYRTTFVNRKMAEMLGYTPEEMLGRRVDTLMFEEDLADHAVRMGMRKNGVNDYYERCFRGKDGRACWCLVSATALRNPDNTFAGSFGMFTDITERKRTEGLHNALHIIADLFLGNNPIEYVYGEIPKILAKPLGFPIVALEQYDETAGEMIFLSTTGINFPSSSTPTRISCHKTASGAVAQSGKALITLDVTSNTDYQHELLRQLGAKTFICVPIRLQDRTFGVLSFADPRIRPEAFDIFSALQMIASHIAQEIARKEALDALQESEDRFRELVETAGAIILRWNPDTTINFANEYAVRLFGYEESELTGKTLFETLVPRIDAQGRDQTAILAAILADPDQCKDHEYETTSKTGRTLLIRWSHRAIRDAQGRLEGILSTGVDISEWKRTEDEKRRLEDQLRQSQRLEAIGQLAGGVAHDFNNLLLVILGSLDIIAQTRGAESRFDRELGEIRAAAERATDLTRQLLAFSRRQEIKPVNLDVNDVIRGVLKMVRRVIGEHIELHSAPGAPLGTVRADRGQLEQVIMNLCVNARDAMPQGGRLTIDTRLTNLEESIRQEAPWTTDGAYVQLRVTDNGTGIDPAIRARIFEPFFTTKKEGAGTGLGLSTVYGIVRQHDGVVHIWSELGKGSSFSIFLPVIEGSIETTAAALDMTPIQGGQETILLAEDERSLRDIVARMLHGAGYQVLTACDGEEAIRLFEEHKDHIHLAMLDVMMPKMSGLNAMEQIRATAPNLKFLLTTGYSEDNASTDTALRTGIRLLPKPYRRNDLLRVIREVLDAEK